MAAWPSSSASRLAAPRSTLTLLTRCPLARSPPGPNYAQLYLLPEQSPPGLAGLWECVGVMVPKLHVFCVHVWQLCALLLCACWTIGRWLLGPQRPEASEKECFLLSELLMPKCKHASMHTHTFFFCTCKQSQSEEFQRPEEGEVHFSITKCTYSVHVINVTVTQQQSKSARLFVCRLP